MRGASALPGAPAEHRSGFVLTDLAAVLLLTVVILALVLLAGDHSRRLSKVGEDLSQLRTIHGSTMSYAADFEDRVWQLGWQSGQSYWEPGDPAATGFIANTPSDIYAARQQATYLIRTLGNRTPSEAPNLAAINLMPHPAYSHLVLLDYLGDAAPTRLFVSSADHRAKWADDPRGYDQGLYTPNLGIGGYNFRHPYGSSFRMGTCFFDNAPVGDRIGPATTTANMYYYNLAGVLGGRPLSLVANSSQKAFLHDTIARHFGPRQTYHMYPEARLPVLMTDGSAAVRPFAEANPGADPNQPTGGSMSLLYAPSPIDPPATGPNSGLVTPGPLWTRMGLAGRDFGGPEVYP